MAVKRPTVTRLVSVPLVVAALLAPTGATVFGSAPAAHAQVQSSDLVLYNIYKSQARCRQVGTELVATTLAIAFVCLPIEDIRPVRWELWVRFP